MVTGNQESIIGGTEKKVISNGDSFTKVGASKHTVVGQDYVVTTDGGDIILGAPAGHIVISGQTTVVDAKNTLMLNAPNIVRSNAAAIDKFKGSHTISAEGSLNYQAGSMTLGSMGAMKITSFGSISQTIGGTSEETLANAPVMAPTAKTIKALLGKIVLETIEPTSGGIQLNVGPMGAAGNISVGTLGNIEIKSTTGPTGIEINANTIAKIVSLVSASIESKLIQIAADTFCKIEAAGIHLNGSTEPAILGNEFWKVFKDHQHSSSVGPTGGILPAYSMKQATTVSKKVFLG